MKKIKTNPYYYADKTFLCKNILGEQIYSDLPSKMKTNINATIKKFGFDIKYTEIKLLKLKYNMAYCRYKYNITFDEYFWYRFYENTHFKNKSFLGIKEKVFLFGIINSFNGISITSDKYKLYKTLGFDFYKRDLLRIFNENDYKKYESFINKNPVFVSKIVNGYGGSGVVLRNIENYADKRVLFNELINDNYLLLEGLILQNAKMKSLHPGSVNTIRVITYIDLDGKISIKYAFIRMGQNGSFVDSGAQGGIFGYIDVNTGRITTNGIDELNIEYKVHPNTGVKIKNFVIPEWEKIRELSIEAAKKLPSNRLTGWDITINEDNECMIVEGNANTTFIAQQICDQKGKKHEFLKFIKYKEMLQCKNSDNNFKYKISVSIVIDKNTKYLEECVNSVIKQSIGFKKNIQLIFIDASKNTKNKKYALKLQKKYKNNIVYKEENNKNIYECKNESLKYLSGKYVNFLDSNDYWGKDVFAYAWNFLEHNGNYVDYINFLRKDISKGCKYSKLKDLSSEPNSKIFSHKMLNNSSTVISSSIFNSKCFEKNNFDTKLNKKSDSKIIYDLLNKECKFSIVKCLYYYVRDESVNINIYNEDNIYEIIDFYREAFDNSLNKNKFILPYIKNDFLKDLVKILVSEDLKILDIAEKNKIYDRLGFLLKNIDDKSIFHCKNIDLINKVSLLKLKYGESILDKININQLNEVKCDDENISKFFGNNNLYINNISIKNNKVKINGYLNIPLGLDLKIICVVYNKKEQIVDLTDLEEENINIKEEKNYYKKRFNINIPIHNNDQEIYFKVKYKKNIVLKVNFLENYKELSYKSIKYNKKINISYINKRICVIQNSDNNKLENYKLYNKTKNKVRFLLKKYRKIKRNFINKMKQKK